MSRRNNSRDDIAISIESLEKSYGGSPAVGPVDLQIDAGEAVLLVGHNGSGKSTLLAMLSGVLEPTSGEAWIFGVEPGSLTGRATLSYLPDTPVLYDDLSVREHVEYVSRLHGLDGDRPELDELIARVGLGERADELPATFSRGLRQRTAIAIAMCRPFNVLLVDEPFVGLDSAGRDAFVDLLDETRARGATIVVATHDAALLGHFDRRLQLHDATLIGDDPLRRLDAASVTTAE